MARKVRVLGLSAIVIGLLLWFAGASWESSSENYRSLLPQEKPVPQVLAVPAELRNIEHWLHAEGQVRAVQKEHLTFEVDGKVVELGQRADGAALREGSAVKAGQLIARLDDKDYRQQVNIANSDYASAETEVNSAKATLAKARTELKLSRKRFNRLSQLQAKGATSKQVLDEAEARLADAKAEVRVSQAQLNASKARLLAAENTLKQARLNLKRTRITAPWAGRIARLNIHKGDYSGTFALNTSSAAQREATFPVTLIDDSQYQVRVDVPGSDLGTLKENETARIRPADTARQQDWTPAFVYSVSPAYSPASRTIRVTLRTHQNQQPQKQLIDGEWVNVRILSQTKQALVIPVAALVYRDNKPTVFTIDQNNVATQRTVETGIRQDNTIEVTKGLSAGELVATDGKKRLTAGDQVKVLAKAGDHHE